MIRAAFLTALLTLAAQAQTAEPPPPAAATPRQPQVAPIPIPRPGDYAPEPPHPSEPAAKAKTPAVTADGAPGTAANGEGDPDAIRAMAVAQGFFESLLAGDTHGVLVRTALPFQLDAQRIADGDALQKIFDDALREKRTDLLTLYGIELLTPQEMEKRYGKPPPRLAALPWRRAGAKIALANLSGHGAVAILHEVQGHWRVIAYTD